MRKTSLLFAAAAVFGISATSVQAAPATNEYNASVVILKQLTIAENTPLSFGKVDLAKSGNSVFTVAPNGTPTVTGTDASFITPPVAGAFTVNGSGDQSVKLTEKEGLCSVSTVLLTGLTLSTETVTLNAISGNATFTLGGTVTVPAGTAAGTVTCAYELTAAY